MGKIKIAFVVTNCKKNGPIKQTLSIIKFIDRSIFEPILITLWEEVPGNSMISEFEELKIPVYNCRTTRTKSIINGAQRLKKVFKEVEPEIVHSVGMPVYRMAITHEPTIHLTTIRNYMFEDYPDKYGKIIGKLLAYFDLELVKKQISNDRAFVTCSKSLHEKYKSLHNINFDYIRNGIDVEKYPKKSIQEIPSLRKKLCLPQNKIIFVYAAGFNNRKNQKEAIEGFLNMKNNNGVILLLLGDGISHESLKNEYGKHEKILFRGEVSNISEYLKASDIYISTSISEGLPNGVLEAMSSGLPLLLSDIPQHLEILETEAKCGLYYELNNTSDLTEKLDQIVEMPLNEMSEISYKALINNFTAKKMSINYQELYNELIINKKDN